MSNQPDPSQVVRMTSPAVAFMQATYLIGPPGLIALIASGEGSLRTLLVSAGVVVAVSLPMLWWSLLNNIETVVTPDSLTRVRKLAWFRHAQTVPLSEIVKLEIRPYSDKLTAHLPGRTIVIATTYSRPHGPLPEVELAPGDARGPLHTLRRIQALVEQRRTSAQAPAA